MSERITEYLGCVKEVQLKTITLENTRPKLTKMKKEDEREKEGMTEQQEAVFRSYGISKEEITRMKKEGLDYQKQSLVDTSIIMLDYLEEKYGISFEVVAGDIPGFHSVEYWITACASEGEHAGEVFDVYYLGEAGCKDGYITILKEEEASIAFRNFIQDKFSDVAVFTKVIGEYGYEIASDIPEDKLLEEMMYQYDLIFTEPNMTNEEFSEKVTDIETYLKDNRINSEGFIFCFYNEIDPDLSIDGEQYLIGYSDELLYKWREFIVTRNMEDEDG